MTELSSILVTGATGKQGRAVIEALKALPSHDFRILALVRDAHSNSAQALKKLNVSLVQGDLNAPEDIFKEPIWGVYSVQTNSDDEIAQGKGLIDAAKAHGVEFFVYASGDRGVNSDTNPTKVKNFAAKFEIEQHLKASGMDYTILRPVTFFENQTNDMHGKSFMRMVMQMDRKIQTICVRDIGWFAAQAFDNPEEYNKKAISIAGDELTGKEMEAIFKEVTGKDMPLAPCLVGKGLKMILRDTVGAMFEFFEEEGYAADVQACRKANPAMIDYRTWLKEYSDFKQ